MKKYKKNKDNFFICEECKKTFKNKTGLGTHIGMVHGAELYYKKYLYDDGDNICKVCENKTKFIGKITKGYFNTCCKKCHYILREEHTKKNLLRLYNVTNVSQLFEVKKKKEKTYLKHYGVNHNFKSNEIKNNIKKTILIKYGVEHPKQSKELQEKAKKTCLKNYGVEYPMQSKEIFEKQQKSACYSKKYKNNINYRGSYELDFLKKYYDKYPNIINGPLIKYQYKRKKKVYHSDFLMPSNNLIVEIKNSYLVKRDQKILEIKKDASKKQGFNYIMIIDKNYKYINEILIQDHESKTYK